MTKAFLVLDDNKFTPLQGGNAQVVFVPQSNSQAIRSVQDLKDRAVSIRPLDDTTLLQMLTQNGFAGSSEGNIPRGSQQYQQEWTKSHQIA